MIYYSASTLRERFQSSLHKLAALGLLLCASTCGKPVCEYYQSVDIDSEVLESSEALTSVTASLYVWPEDDE